mmetsp:Transcript_9193/g.18618  ORF Transcript_9193/g.18618 Transcript_9193/m.18618 type:complete len:229 (+) Transcript_9193:540-1226(+)
MLCWLGHHEPEGTALQLLLLLLLLFLFLVLLFLLVLLVLLPLLLLSNDVHILDLLNLGLALLDIWSRLGQILVSFKVVLRCVGVGLAVLVQFTLLDHRLLPARHGTETPAAGVEVTLHDNPLNLSHNPMVTRSHDARAHLRDAHGHSLSLRGHNNNLLPHINAVREPKKSRNHQLGAIAYSIDGRVLDDDPLLVDQEKLEGLDDAAEVGLVFRRVVDVLGVKDVVHGY